jgi:UDP-N-acetylglucosamine 2-epimerase (non-hydrolysing)
MKRILIVFGTRPEAIKMAPLVKGFEQHTHEFDTRVCITGQHREMLDQVLEIFNIKADYDLNIMKAGQDLYDITSRVLIGMRDVLKDFKPDLVMVHGDTTTSASAALAAFYQQVPVAHVEAGLRTGNVYAPWPEEMNRMITRCLTQFHYAPTETSRKNLLKENVNDDNIVVTGNTVIDALLYINNRIRGDVKLQEELKLSLENKGYPVDDGKKFILITGHRRENFGEGFINICRAIQEVALKYPDIDLLYPVHLNPNVQKPVYEILDGIPNVFLVEPLEYLQFIYLMDKSFIVLTDSGGIQEEAPSLGKPVLVMRDTTERPEAVKAGTVKLVGTNRRKIVNAISDLIENKEVYDKMSRSHNPYGDGNAVERIIHHLELILNQKPQEVLSAV